MMIYISRNGVSSTRSEGWSRPEQTEDGKKDKPFEKSPLGHADNSVSFFAVPWIEHMSL